MTYRAELSCVGMPDGLELDVAELLDPLIWADMPEAAPAMMMNPDEQHPVEQSTVRRREFWLVRHPNGVPYRHDGRIVYRERQ